MVLAYTNTETNSLNPSTYSWSGKANYSLSPTSAWTIGLWTFREEKIKWREIKDRNLLTGENGLRLKCSHPQIKHYWTPVVSICFHGHLRLLQAMAAKLRSSKELCLRGNAEPSSKRSCSSPYHQWQMRCTGLGQLKPISSTDSYSEQMRKRRLFSLFSSTGHEQGSLHSQWPLATILALGPGEKPASRWHGRWEREQRSRKNTSSWRHF